MTIVWVHACKEFQLEKDTGQDYQDFQPSRAERNPGGELSPSLAKPSKQFPKSGCPQNSVVFLFLFFFLY